MSELMPLTSDFEKAKEVLIKFPDFAPLHPELEKRYLERIACALWQERQRREIQFSRKEENCE